MGYIVGLCVFIGLIVLIILVNRVDDVVVVKSSRAVEAYNYTDYFKEDKSRLYKVEQVVSKNKVFKIRVSYTSPAGRRYSNKVINISAYEIGCIKANPELIMTTAEINQQIKAQKQAEKEQQRIINEQIKAQEKALKDEEKERIWKEKEAQKEEARALLEGKQHTYYDKVNSIIDHANSLKDSIVIKNDGIELDKLMGALFDRTVNSIKKIKDINSEEWGMFDSLLSNSIQNIQTIEQKNRQIIDYYESVDFQQIKNTCQSLMDSQREFNEYIEEKAESISSLFGSKVVRSATINDDQYSYIRPYKKTISPFTAEVSNAVFASAENNPIDYIIKYFYPNKVSYPEQIRKLQMLIGELETLREAKDIIENYKKDYQQYLSNVPAFIMENDEDGFYSRLGFAIINESVLTVEYKFIYTSNGGKAQRSFSVPMTEETIIELIERLESKLTIDSFKSEQRALMTKKMREHIKERDKYTCRYCDNSIYKEPNLLLEIDHIVPIAKGGYTVEDNLQTLCWKCNRAKGSKII